MGQLLLHHPVVQCYLLWVTVSFLALMWDYHLRNRRTEARRPPEASQRAPGRFESASSHTLAGRTRGRRRTQILIRPFREARRLRGAS
jgi:hypothetical protein